MMTFSLMPVVSSALIPLAGKIVRQLDPGQFLREFCSGPSNEPMANSTADGQHATGDGATPNLPQAVAEFSDALRQRLAGLGVDLSQPLVLKDDGQSGVVLDGDHPDRALVEALFAEDRELRERVQELALLARQQRDTQSFPYGGRFGEFRLQLDTSSAAIRFE